MIVGRLIPAGTGCGDVRLREVAAERDREISGRQAKATPAAEAKALKVA